MKLVLNLFKIEQNEEKKDEEEEEKKEIFSEGKKDELAEDKKDIPQEEMHKNENPDQMLSSENINYNDTWKNKLDKIKDKFKVKILKTEEERVLIECIRFSYLSHSDLLSLSVDPIIQNHKDLVEYT